MDHLLGCPEIIVNGFMASGITPSIDAHEPVEEETDYEEETDDDEEILD